MTENICDNIQEEDTEPACALLVTLRVLRVYIWASVLYGNILFRYIEYSFEVEEMQKLPIFFSSSEDYLLM